MWQRKQLQVPTVLLNSVLALLQPAIWHWNQRLWNVYVCIRTRTHVSLRACRIHARVLLCACARARAHIFLAAVCILIPALRHKTCCAPLIPHPPYPRPPSFSRIPFTHQVLAAHAAASPNFCGIRAPYVLHGGKGHGNFAANMALLEAKGLVYDLGVSCASMHEAVEIAKAYPKVTMVLNHCGVSQVATLGNHQPPLSTPLSLNPAACSASYIPWIR